MALQKGDKAPDFKFISTETEEVTLSDYQGKNLLLLFFPLAFTGVCTQEMCDMRDGLQSYNSLNAEVLAVSVDSPMVLGKFKEELDLNFKLASDFNADAVKAYGAVYDEFVLGMRNVAKRSAFVIDSDGVIQYAEVLESAGDLPDFAAVKTALGGLSN